MGVDGIFTFNSYFMADTRPVLRGEISIDSELIDAITKEESGLYKISLTRPDGIFLSYLTDEESILRNSILTNLGD